jgi:hypothetical protein
LRSINSPFMNPNIHYWVYNILALNLFWARWIHSSCNLFLWVLIWKQWWWTQTPVTPVTMSRIQPYSLSLFQKIKITTKRWNFKVNMLEADLSQYFVNEAHKNTVLISFQQSLPMCDMTIFKRIVRAVPLSFKKVKGYCHWQPWEWYIGQFNL